jgi:hypothetical protein
MVLAFIVASADVFGFSVIIQHARESNHAKQTTPALCAVLEDTDRTFTDF